VLFAEVGDIGKTEVRRFDLYNTFSKYAIHRLKMSPLVQDALFRTAENRLLDAFADVIVPIAAS